MREEKLAFNNQLEEVLFKLKAAEAKIKQQQGFLAEKDQEIEQLSLSEKDLKRKEK
jgi:chromosome segregation ATPase